MVAQHENIIAVSPVSSFSQTQMNNLNYVTSANPQLNGNLEKSRHTMDAVSPEAVNQENEVSNANQTSSSSNTSLISVSTLNSRPFFSLAFLPDENKAQISAPNMVYTKL